MKIRKSISKILAVSLAAATMTGMAALPVSATVLTDQTVVKVSNPENGERQADGLVEGGDRETSYAWCMTARGDYVYIGTNKNIVGSGVNSIASGLQDYGIDSESAWRIVDVMTNGEVPHINTTEGGQILRVDCKTNEIEVIYTAPAETSFRMAITHGDNVFFGSYSTDTSFTVDNGQGLSNDIFRIDKDDNVEKVFESFNGTSMRAACEFEGSLYFGGVDASEEIAEGWEGSAKLAILCMDETDNSKWSRVADYRDFGLRYAKDPSLNSAAASPIWDICEFDGDLYATLPGSFGFSMFRGHPTKEDETPNDYGWTWEEVVGFNNGINPIGLRTSGANVNGASPQSVVATPVVFKGDLYLFDFDHTIGAETKALTGIMQKALGADVKASDYLKPMYNTLRHTQSLWKYNKETGKFDKVENFSKLLEGTTNEYVWRAQEYEGELYITTMDSAVLYNYVTKLTNGSFINMSEEEWKSQIEMILNLSTLLVPSGDDKVDAAKTKIEEAASSLENLFDQAAESGDYAAYVDQFNAAYADVLSAVAELDAALATKAGYTKLKEAITAQTGDVAGSLVELGKKVKDYFKKNDPTEAVIPDEEAVFSICDLSDEELKAYFYEKRDTLISYCEAMKADIPELRMMSSTEISGLVMQYIIEAMQKPEVKALMEKVSEYKQKSEEASAKRQETFRKILEFFFVDLPEQKPEEEVEKESAIKKYISEYVQSKLSSVAEKAWTKLNEKVDAYNAKAALVNAQIDEIELQLETVSNKAQEAINAIDWDGLAMYAYISEMVKKDTWGFDMLKTSDGENFEIVTNDGFGDKYNYGGRSMVATPYGLYVGTANPFYGAQLFVLNNNGVEPVVENKFENTSSLNSDVAQIGDTVKITGAAQNNTGKVTYSYYYKRSQNTRWILLGQEDTASTTANLIPQGAADYDIKVIAKDNGTSEASEKIMKLSVSGTLAFANASVLNVGDTSEVGKTIVISGRSVGGKSPVTYKYYFKRSVNTNWKTLTAANQSGSYAKFAPTAEAEYDIKVIATDSEGTVSEKVFTVKTTPASN